MAVTVTVPSILARHAGGQRTHTVGGETLGEALTLLTRDYPELGRKLAEATAPETAFVTIYVNDEDARFLGGLSASLKDGDDVSVVSAIAGG